MKILITIVVALVLLAVIPDTLLAQEHTVGLFIYDSSSYDGYTLFCPMPSTTTYLIDNYGRLVHSWEGTAQPRLSVYLRENGNLLRTIQVTGSGGEIGGGFQEVAWDGTVIWEYQYYSDNYLQHHDIEPLPNGNVLVLAWENKSRAEAIDAGRDPSFLNGDVLSPEHVVEVAGNDSIGHEIVWEWHLWDHLIQDFDSTKDNYGIVADHPELMDINFAKRPIADWNHANAVAYNPELDQIIICSHALEEIWVIDHSTTTEEAAGHTGGNSGMGGDILYRWGNPQGYRAGDESDKKYYGQHDAHWVPDGYPGAGNILVFNNGRDRPDAQYSTIEEITPPIDSNGNYLRPASGNPYGPDSTTWNYTADPPEDLYSENISGCQRLPNGNTLICSGDDGTFLEVTPAGDIVWKYINPISGSGPLAQGDPPTGAINIFKCRRYSPDFPGLQGHDLTPSGQLEIYPITVSGTQHAPLIPNTDDTVFITASVESNGHITLVRLYYNNGGGYDSLTMFDDGHHNDGPADDGTYGAAISPQPPGTKVLYYLKAEDDLGSSVIDPPLADEITYNYSVISADFICGDSNGDEALNIFDITYIIAYLYLDGPSPEPIESADVNVDDAVNIFDATYMISYLYLSGPPPCEPE